MQDVEEITPTSPETLTSTSTTAVSTSRQTDQLTVSPETSRSTSHSLHPDTAEPDTTTAATVIDHDVLRERIKVIFDFCDKDHDGFLSSADIRRMYYSDSLTYTYLSAHFYILFISPLTSLL